MCVHDDPYGGLEIKSQSVRPEAGHLIFGGTGMMMKQGWFSRTKCSLMGGSGRAKCS